MVAATGPSGPRQSWSTRATAAAVISGHRGEAEAEVLGGLRAGEEVVLYPSDKVVEGVRVRE